MKNRYYRQDKTRNKESRIVTDDNAQLHWIKANGIDRLNSIIGYTIENCVPCCEKCNLMKSNYSENEFLDHIERIRNFQKELNETKSKS